MGETLFTSNDPELWKKRLQRYDSVMKKKSEDKKKKELRLLDSWFQNDLPKAISARSPRHVTKEEIIKLMKWKLMRGKFRPRLTQLVEQNSVDDVKTISENAFKKPRNVAGPIKELSKLKAIGPATASAILCAANPEIYPFMADEVMEAIPGFKREYTVGAYSKMQSEIGKKAETLTKASDVIWTPHNVELALWTDATARKLGMDLEIPLDKDSADGNKRKKMVDEGSDNDEEHEVRRKKERKTKS
eukprot:Seg1666.18 transcript_id=Seg1666.18/GoldUCD/mRNA.D3Y31 product="hypothetical protein" protein_id=Seg1666.18/GoldUCD/D3Y31